VDSDRYEERLESDLSLRSALKTHLVHSICAAF
jgi:hypothetical protein